MKPPDHPVPSGDRAMARLVMRALETAGHEVRLASRLRAWSDGSDALAPERIARRGARIAERLIARWRGAADGPQAWVTYHLYHKAPDWIGPLVAEALDIPYVVIEASHAPKQADGRFASGFRAAAAAIRRADAVFALSARDEEGLRRLRGGAAGLHRLPPFLDADAYARPPSGGSPLKAARAPWLLATGMMRPGDKQASYAVLADALARLTDHDWRLAVIGDGPAGEAIRRDLVARLGPGRCLFLGQCEPPALRAALRDAALFVWPAVNEAYGVAILEAQAAGLPVVAGRAGGVPEIVTDGATGLLTPPGDALAFARAVARLLDNPAAARSMGQAARCKAQAAHDLPQAAARLNAALQAIIP